MDSPATCWYLSSPLTAADIVANVLVFVDNANSELERTMFFTERGYSGLLPWESNDPRRCPRAYSSSWTTKYQKRHRNIHDEVVTIRHRLRFIILNVTEDLDIRPHVNYTTWAQLCTNSVHTTCVSSEYKWHTQTKCHMDPCPDAVCCWWGY